MVLFDYREGRGREDPHEILKDFRGHLQRMVMLSMKTLIESQALHF